jgi:hypothetical protein
MPRNLNRLSARRVETEKRPGRRADGGGLYLSISPSGHRPTKSLIRRAFKSDAEVVDFARRRLREKRDEEFDLMLAELLHPVLYSGEMAKVAA